jgi:hypothetical protein
VVKDGDAKLSVGVSGAWIVAPGLGRFDAELTAELTAVLYRAPSAGRQKEVQDELSRMTEN